MIANTDGVSAADYNAWMGLATVPAGTWNDAADGTIYNTPLSVTPGVHDIPNVNPDFVDPTRSLQTWDAMLGGPGTLASALARIQADPTLTTTSLLPWVKAGYAPTNPALDGTGSDGTYIGAVPFQSSSSAATTYTLTGPDGATVSAGPVSFMVIPDGSYTGTVTPSDGGRGGTFNPPSLSWTGISTPQSFTYMPASAGTVTVSTTSSPAADRSGWE